MRLLTQAAVAIVATIMPPSYFVGSGAAVAQTGGLSQAGFEAYLPQLRAEALRRGVRQSTIDAIFPTLQFSARTIQLDQAQPGGVANSNAIPAFAPYRERHVNAALISRGRARYSSHIGRLNAIGRRYGVTPSVLVAIWGHETSYGAVTGDFDLMNSLASLAYEGRRRQLFTDEFIATLKMYEKGYPRSRLKGSWAGATGYPQFLPTVYLRVAAEGARPRPAALGMSMLPSAPPLYLALAEAFERHAPLHEVATLIQSDPAITAKLLQLVNSSFFVDAERVTCVRRAAEKLGAQRLRELLLAAELFQGSPAAAATATHGLRVARLARGLAPAFADDAYLAGLLHDVGRLVLDAPAGATETFHARVGGVLLGVWGLPIEVVRAVAFHHDPDASPDPTDPRLRAVALAEALVGEIEDPTLPRAIVEQRSAALGVSPDEVRARALAS